MRHFLPNNRKNKYIQRCFRRGRQLTLSYLCVHKLTLSGMSGLALHSSSLALQDLPAVVQAGLGWEHQSDVSGSALCLVWALLDAGWLCAQLLLPPASCGWDALSASRALQRGALGLCPTGGAELCCGTLAQCLQAGIALLLLLSPCLRAIAAGPGSPLVQICVTSLAGTGAGGIAGLVREQTIHILGEISSAQESKTWEWMCYLWNMPKEQTPGEVFKIDVGTSNGHELAMNKFGLEVKFLTVRRIKVLDNILIAEAREEFKSNTFRKLSEMGLVASGLSLYQEEP